MKIVVAVRCYNESKNIDRFLRGYDWADEIVVSDGGSEDDSVSKLEKHPKVRLFHFTERETRHGYTWNPDNPHIQFVIDEAKKLDPTWIILDDFDDVPNFHLRKDARLLFEIPFPHYNQINAFRLYLWGDDKFFPAMNKNFHEDYRSLWAWRPNEVNIQADMSVRHGTLLGLQDNYLALDIPYCLLHKSWHPDTIDEKVLRYNKLGLPMNNPLSFAGELADLPEWAVE